MKLLGLVLILFKINAGSAQIDLINDTTINPLPETTVLTPMRSFLIDYDNDVFRMDGMPFRYVAGSIHYFRSPHQYWRSRLRSMRASGINVVSTYVEWSFHEPQYRKYKWDGDHDLVKFIQIAQGEGLYVILRPGPYICAERDMGGFPYWLLTKYPNIKLRTNDFDYKNEVRVWYSVMMDKIRPYLYGNGGPIIMVQVENEYGSFDACDNKYMAWLAQLTSDLVQGAAVLFTTDGTSNRALRCGSTPGAYATIDFGTGTNSSVAWKIMRKYSPRGPLVNSEFYPGWLTHWGERAATVRTEAIIKTMDDMIDDGANFNFYMFHGGTNFGFTAGANLAPNYVPDLTSYDYDAPLTEAGDTTPKFYAIRDKILEFMPDPNVTEATSIPKADYGKFEIPPYLMFLSVRSKKQLGKQTKDNPSPLTMEAMDQYSGILMYETVLPKWRPDPSLLTIFDLRDRAYIYVDNALIGILSRTRNITSIPIMANSGTKLQILVENQGRVNFMLANDFKGIGGRVLLNGVQLNNWKMTSFPLDDFNWASYVGHRNTPLNTISDEYEVHPITTGTLRDGPVLYISTVKFDNCNTTDTFIDMTGWGKGIVWVNNRNLGRYWPNEGPQVTLYLPGVYLNGYPDCVNTVVILELQNTPADYKIEFVSVPNLGYNK